MPSMENCNIRCPHNAILNFSQVQRLHEVIENDMEIHGRGNFPTLQVCVRELVQAVLKRIEDSGLLIKHVKLNGGAASHVMANWDMPFNDVDLIFNVELTSYKNFDIVKRAVLDTLMDLLPNGTNRTRISSTTLQDAYIRKLVKVADKYDRWSLISLNNNFGRYIELKFVDQMKRQFEFSVDSFQIHLDSLLTFYSTGVVVMDPPRRRSLSSVSGISSASSVSDSEDRFSSCSPLYTDTESDLSCLPSPVVTSEDSAVSSCKSPSVKISPRFYPSVVVESVFGNIQIAQAHLNNKRIDTRLPEEIRGGGLLKYCNLLVRGYRAVHPRKLQEMERYMCSRFFIDFPDINVQHRKLTAYLDNHFGHDFCSKYEYLMLLGTVCLMNQERMFSLEMIDNLAAGIYTEIEKMMGDGFVLRMPPGYETRLACPPPPAVCLCANCSVESKRLAIFSPPGHFGYATMPPAFWYH